jgi:hypothetical protein
MRTVDASPKASVLIESMRDIGYSLETALADVVDNSITAGASTIELFADTSTSDIRIGIVDDGEGMTEPELLAAMRLGSRNPLQERNAGDLGRFGLGLKIASFSQCRRLTVVTRRDGKTSAAIWDFDHVAKTDEWEVQIPDDTNAIPWADRLGKRGTLVVWENLDRIVEKNGAENALAHFIRCMDEAREHLELVFHRFLSGESGLRKIRMLLNERPLEPFDPFNIGHPATIPGPMEKIKVGRYEVTVQTFTLPHHRKVTPSEWERYAGRAGYVKNQGFYLYRQKRLIIHGTWFGLARQMELTKLARVRIDMPNGLDAEWKIDVKKASAQPPYQVRERLRRIIETLGANSKRVYTARGRRLISDNRLPVWNRIQDKNEIVYRINSEHPVLADFIARLPANLKADFFRVVEIAGSSLPMDALFADLGGEPDKVTGNATSDETLRYAVNTTCKLLVESGVKMDDIMDMMRLAEPFRSNWQRTEEILNEPIAQEAQRVGTH